MSRLPNNLHKVNELNFEPKRILFGDSENERKDHYKNQFDILIKHWDKIPWRQWGVGSSKNLATLLREIGDGETFLSVKNGKLIRNLEIVIVFLLTKDSKWLVEGAQHMPDGRIRNRRFPYISEQLRLGESSVDTALRAINEETGHHIDPEKRRLIKGDIHILDQNHAYNTGSTSYPGLKSHKKAYTFAYIVNKKEYKPKYTEIDITGYVTVHSWKKIRENIWFTNTSLQKKVRKYLK